MTDQRLATALLAAVGALATILVACGDDNASGGQATAEEGTFVGKVEGSDAYIALIANGTELTGFLCDGKQLSTWFGEPDLANGQAQLISRRSEARRRQLLEEDPYLSGRIDYQDAAATAGRHPDVAGPVRARPALRQSTDRH